MNIKQLKQQLFDLEQQIRDQVQKIGTKEIARITGISQTELSSFVSGNRIFSYKRLIRIAEKLMIDN